MRSGDCRSEDHVGDAQALLWQWWGYAFALQVEGGGESEVGREVVGCQSVKEDGEIERDGVVIRSGCDCRELDGWVVDSWLVV